MSRRERIAVYAAVFLGGAMLMALEVAAFRIIGKTFGSALRETTAVIAVFLAAMSLGYWAGGWTGDRWPRPSTLVAVLLGAAGTLLIVPWLDAATSPRIAASQLELATHAFLATGLLFAIPTFLFAGISPIAIRLMVTTLGHSGSTAGSISAVSTAGSIAGSIVTAFFLIDWLASVTRTVLFVAAGACVTAAMLAIATATREHARRYALVVGGAIVLIGLPALLFIRSSRLDRSLLAPSREWRVLFVADSPYHRVTVREGRNLRLLTFSAGEQSRMRLDDPFGPGSAYTDAFHIARFLRPGLRRVLVIGLGGATTAKQFVRDYPDVTVDVVEIDPLVVDVAKRFFHLQPNERVRVHVGDGRMFLKRSREQWDLIIIDAYTVNRYGDTIPPHLVTREFFEDARARLSAAGIVHFHCAFTRSKLVPALHKTMGNVFPSVLISGGEILGSNVPLLTAQETLIERVRRSPAARYPNLIPYISALENRPPADGAVPLLTDDYAPVDTLIRSR